MPMSIPWRRLFGARANKLTSRRHAGDQWPIARFLCILSVHISAQVAEMKTLSYTAVRNNLAKVIDEVNEDHAPIIITRQKGDAAVLVSLEDFESWQETAYLARSPAMRRRLRSAVAQLESGKGRTRRLTK